MSINTFAIENAIDKLTVAIGAEPFQFRLVNLEVPRMAEVLKALRTLSNWSTRASPSRARGVAIARGLGSWLCDVAKSR